MKNNITDSNKLKTEEIKQMINNEVNEIHIIAKNLASSYAQRQFPSASGVKLSLVVGEIKAKCEKLIITVFKELQSVVEQPNITLDKVKAEREIKKSKDLINELKYKKQQLETEQKKINIKSIYQNINELKIKTFLFFGAEVLFTSLSFQFFGENLLVSILIAIPFTLAVSEYAHLVAIHYRKYTYSIKRRLFLFFSVLFAVCVFFGLAYFRSQALGKEGLSVSTLFFVFINLFIFLVSSFLHFKYSMTKEEKIKYYAFKHLKKEIEIIDTNIHRIEEQIRDIHSKYYEKALLAIQIKHFALNTIEEIRKHYEESVEKFKSTNILLRTDKVIPECFSEPTPKLKVNTDFGIYKLSNKENTS